ncbi:hypothetical protein EDD37DRAFT_440363 [Exophiala viscosa]|uniref:Maintenance of telomere capping protein 6 n=1 Tax=Exophiala viscosa TaxID=2486360 RepID=A0AAN6DSE1_9EURO|nr:hypothetical protein EDD36DRAFT_286317 [Exophiala viscosa]KAI1623786.1 hypothetical protein EDD37DRAFT_440363 [Exophiala viscosa]
MSLSYSPSSDAVPDSYWSTVYLSTRDAGGRVPIDFITHPGIYLTKACFPHGVYDDVPTQTCMSDLLATSFRRIIIDLYWDSINLQFNLCPVELPPLAGNSTSGYSVDTSALYSITASSFSTATSPSGTLTASDAGSLAKRQSTENNFTSAATTSTVSSTPTSALPVPTTTGVSGNELIELGPYTCSLDLNLESIMSFYSDYFDQTSNTVSADIHYLTINLHAASPFTSPLAPADAPMQGRGPGSSDLIGAQFKSNLPLTLYTPAELSSDRSDLNSSWFRDDYGMITDTDYFTTTKTDGDANGNTVTQNGWPGLEWIIGTAHRRLLLSWGEVDPQMDAYEFQNDSAVFSDDYLASSQSISVNNAGTVQSGCFFEAGNTTVQSVNASWAFAVANQASSSQALYHLAQNLTACGISPILNMTLGNATVQNNLDQYAQFAQSSIIGWASGEPRNSSQTKRAETSRKATSNDYACAVLDSTSGYLGRWRADQCQNKRRAACRIANEPYAWRLSTFNVPYSSAPNACPNSTKFDLPRTGLENTYLYRQILNDTSSSDGTGILSGVWIDFNSLDQAGCWVAGGPNASCPYSTDPKSENQREVLIPTIAALIVLLLTVLTLLVKCNENRRNRKTRRRGNDGWEYEGVPS